MLIVSALRPCFSPKHIITASPTGETLFGTTDRYHSCDSEDCEVISTPSSTTTALSELGFSSTDDLQTPPSPRSALKLAAHPAVPKMEARGSKRQDHRRLSVSTTTSSSMQGSSSSSVSPRVIDTYRYDIPCPPLESPQSEDVIPKIEEIDEDLDIKLSPVDQTITTPTSGTGKRRRGRPPKINRTTESSGSSSRVPRARTKTGCVTCRRRKKKCDEAKPSCDSCRKNNVFCEGYPEMSFWKGGRQKALRGTKDLDDNSPAQSSEDGPKLLDLPPLVAGIETELDYHLLQYFKTGVCPVLALLADESQNPFIKILLPMAWTHRGLMHSLLCLAASHMLAKQPVFNDQVASRQEYHLNRAYNILGSNANLAAALEPGNTQVALDDPTSAQIIILCQKSICEGNVYGEHQTYLRAAENLIRRQQSERQQSENDKFRTFLVEFLLRQDVSHILTSSDRRSVLMMDDFHLPEFMIQPEAGDLLGVLNSLFGFISKTRNLRDRIRERKQAKSHPAVDYDIMNEALGIERDLDAWKCPHESGPRFTASELYLLATWLYLYRTTQPCKVSDEIVRAVDNGLNLLRDLPKDSAVQNVLLMPLFLLGCSAFERRQRPEIRQAFAALLEHSNMRNIQYAQLIVDEVWTMMDANDERSWDWETIIADKGWDFLIT